MGENEESEVGEIGEIGVVDEGGKDVCGTASSGELLPSLAATCGRGRPAAGQMYMMS